MTAEFLLISDLDDTLLGDDAALRRFADYYDSLSPRLAIVYASGRSFESMRDDVRITALPEPMDIISGVGSEIRKYPDGEMDAAWVERISRHWSAEKVRELLADEPDMKLQPESEQLEFKASYFLHDATTERLVQLREKLQRAGVETSYVYSSNQDLDFLPRGVDKGAAALFLSRQLGFDPDHVMVAGNSGNDSRLFEHHFHGIIVANSHDELKQLASDPANYLSPHSHADGVRDGVEHWLREDHVQIFASRLR